MRPRIGVIALLFVIMPGCGPDGSNVEHGEKQRPPGAAQVRLFSFPDPDIVLMVTGGTHGLLEVCNCPGPMPGGLARRSGMVLSYRAAFDEVFVLDTGDVFWFEPEDLRNEYVLKGYARTGYDAVVLGDQEWSALGERLDALLSEAPLTYVSTTVAPADGVSRLPIVTEVKHRRGAVKLAVLSYLPRETFLFWSKRKLARLRFRTLDELSRRAEALKHDGWLVVVVAHTGDAETEKLAAACPADLIVRGNTSRCAKELLTAAGKPVAKVGGTERVGVIAMKLAPGGKVEQMEYRLEVVDDHWPLDARLLEVYQAYAHAAMRQAMDAERVEGLAYVPSSECSRCHETQYRAWTDGPHVGAYKVLQERKRTGDPNCLMCHTAGFGAETGFRTFEDTPDLAGVNCQNCHRFGVDEHRREGFRIPEVNEEVCTSCHTPRTSPKFSFEARLGHVGCARACGPKPGH